LADEEGHGRSIRKLGGIPNNVEIYAPHIETRCAIIELPLKRIVLEYEVLRAITLMDGYAMSKG
jgi:hypothetical protein